MDTDAATSTQQSLPLQQQSQAALIRAEQVRSLPHLTDQQKAQYETGIRNLWKTIQSHEQDSQEHQAARHKLLEVTTNIKRSWHKWQQAVAAQGQRLGMPAQPKPQAQGPQPQQAPAGNPQQPQQVQLPPAIINSLQNFPFTPPPSLPANSPEAYRWVAEAKARYGQNLHKMDGAKQRLTALQSAVHQREASGKPLTPEEQTEFNEQRVVLLRSHTEARRYIDQFRQQQLEFAAQRQSQAAGGAGSPGLSREGSNHEHQSQQPLPAGTEQPTQASQPAPTPEVKSEDTVMTGEASLGHHGNDGPTSMSPSSAEQNVQAPPRSQPSNVSPSQPQNGQIAPPNLHSIGIQPGNSINTTVNTPGASQRYPPPPGFQQHTSPHTAQPPSATQPARQPTLTQDGALDEISRTYSNGNQTSTPPAAAVFNHGHQTPTARDTIVSSHKMPIPRTLDLPSPQPVNIGPARPTYSGGASNGANGILGQPAYQKVPAYVPEGESDRVLSKKKLDELVRQVTGGGEGLGGQLLSPDCEEVSDSVLSESTSRAKTYNLVINSIFSERLLYFLHSVSCLYIPQPYLGCFHRATENATSSSNSFKASTAQQYPSLRALRA